MLSLNKSKIILLAAFLSLTVVSVSGVHKSALAAGEKIEYPDREWSFEGMMGTFDRSQLQRGFQVYREVCAACHGLKRVYYRNLAALGYSEAQIKAVAAEYTVIDGPDDEGEMFDRPGRPSDNFVSPYPNVNAARAVNNGTYPYDLSLITKARAGGADYITALLTGYNEPPADVEVMAGMHWNDYYSGHQIAMAKPLSDGQLSYADGTEATTEQMAKDVSAFLTWAAEPSLEVRKRMGIKVLIFLSIFAFILYLVKRKIWADVKH
jgi:ubiquinol-cytochrome c reductase cytochrome c1 subunit